MVCLLPLILIGYVGTIQTSWHTSADISGPYAEVQTCKDGLALRGAVGNQWVQVGPQYGYSATLPYGLALTGQIHGGLGYSNTIHPVSNIRQITTLNLGFSVLISKERYYLKGGYDHMSNGRGIDPTNAGQDFWSIAGGLTF